MASSATGAPTQNPATGTSRSRQWPTVTGTRLCPSMCPLVGSNAIHPASDRKTSTQAWVVPRHGSRSYARPDHKDSPIRRARRSPGGVRRRSSRSRRLPSCSSKRTVGCRWGGLSKSGNIRRVLLQLAEKVRRVDTIGDAASSPARGRERQVETDRCRSVAG